MRLKSARHRPKRSQTRRFCHCIKSVRRKPTQKEEKRAIAICVSSVLHKRGRTLKRFRCRSPAFLRTQPLSRSAQ